MPDLNSSPDPVTEQVPRFPQRPTDTAPLPMVQLGGPPPEPSQPPATPGYPGQPYPQPGPPQPGYPAGHGPGAPTPPRRDPRLLGYLWKGLGLVGVAAVSGLLWATFSGGGGHNRPPAAGTTTPAGAFRFDRAAQTKDPLRDSNCAEHSYGKVKEFFQSTPCQELTRALYTTTTDDGRTVYTSVSVVRMRSAQDANALIALTNQDNTGNVADIVKDGAVKVPDLTTLANGGYASKVEDAVVTIVESDSASKGDKAKDHDLFKRISTDALRLSQEVAS